MTTEEVTTEKPAQPPVETKQPPVETKQEATDGAKVHFFCTLTYKTLKRLSPTRRTPRKSLEKTIAESTKSKRKAWREFTSEINDLSTTAKVAKVMQFLAKWTIDKH